MPQEALRSKLRLAPKVFDAVLALATANGLIVDEGANVRLSSHVIQLTPEQQQQLDALLSRFHRQPYTPPSVKESTEAVGTEMLNMLIDRGDLVQVSPAVLFLPETYEEMVEHIKQHIERKGSIDLAQTRDMFNSSRKYAQALLEHLDAIEVTERVGDKRILR
jgi:selenocysteine-specific elongation factor